MFSFIIVVMVMMSLHSTKRLRQSGGTVKGGARVWHIVGDVGE